MSNNNSAAEPQEKPNYSLEVYMRISRMRYKLYFLHIAIDSYAHFDTAYKRAADHIHVAKMFSGHMFMEKMNSFKTPLAPDWQSIEYQNYLPNVKPEMDEFNIVFDTELKGADQFIILLNGIMKDLDEYMTEIPAVNLKDQTAQGHVYAELYYALLWIEQKVSNLKKNSHA